MEKITKLDGSVEAALASSGRTAANRRVVVALIAGATTSWWGGSIDDWGPEEALLTSRIALDVYWKLVREFRAGGLPTAHAIMVYRDGRFASVMLGVSTIGAARAYLGEAMELARTRSAHAWLKA